MTAPLKFAAIGIDHRHIFGMAQNLIDAGAEFVGWFTEGNPAPTEGFTKRFPNVPRVETAESLLGDSSIALIVLSGIPRDRAAWAVKAMDAGKDVMSDKPGCTTFDQLKDIEDCVARTKRIWTIDFSERFEVPSVTKAAELVADGAIGRVIQTVGLGPHRLNRATRPDWFFDRQAYGGILADIGSHQIDQFLFFTGSQDAEITMANVTLNGVYANMVDAILKPPRLQP